MNYSLQRLIHASSLIGLFWAPLLLVRFRTPQFWAPLLVVWQQPKMIFWTFAEQKFRQHFCLSKAGTFLSIHFSIFFSRNDVSGQCLRGAEGESSPQSPPAGAFLLKNYFAENPPLVQNPFLFSRRGCSRTPLSLGEGSCSRTPFFIRGGFLL